MLANIVEVQPLDGLRLALRFEDGVYGVVDLRSQIRLHGVFAPLADPREFARLRFDRELGTVVWPCGADLDPDVLHALVTGSGPPGFSAKPSQEDRAPT